MTTASAVPPLSSPAGRPAPASLFVYGTLLDPEILARVSGRAGAWETTAARLDGHRVARSGPDGLPVLRPAEASQAVGRVLLNVSAEEFARIVFFEAAEYDVAPVTVRREDGQPVATWAFLPTAARGAPAEGEEPDWSVESWPGEDRRIMRAAAAEFMSHFGVTPLAVVDELWPEILARAEKSEGRARRIRAERGRADVTVLRRERPYSDFFSVDTFDVTHRAFRGGEIAPITRSVFISGPAVSMLPYDPARDLLLLIEQWRSGAWAAEDPNPWTIEAVAGRVEPGQTPEDAARREALEEANVAIGRAVSLGRYYSAPGIANETVESFVGEADLSSAGGVHGLVEEGEDIRVLVLGFEEAMAAAEHGEINAGPALLSLLWLARNRARLQLEWSTPR